MHGVIISVYYYLFNSSAAFDWCSLLFIVGLCHRRWESAVCIGCTQLHHLR